MPTGVLRPSYREIVTAGAIGRITLRLIREAEAKLTSTPATPA